MIQISDRLSEILRQKSSFQPGFALYRAERRTEGAMYINNIVQELSSDLAAPLILLDADMELVAHSVHQNIEHDPTQITMIVSRRGTEGAIQSFERFRVKYSSDPVRIPGAAGGRGHVVVTLRSSGTVTGYLSFPDVFGLEIPEQTTASIKVSAEKLGEALLERSLDSRRSREHIRQLVAGLLGNDIHLREYAQREIVAGRLLSESATHTAIQMSIRAHGRNASSPSHLLQESLSRLTGPGTRRLGTIIDGNAVLITPGPMDSLDLANLLATMGLDTVIAAAGTAVGSLMELGKSYRQASIAIQGPLRDPGTYGNCTTWDELGNDKFLLQLPLDEMSWEDLPEGLRRLHEARNSEILIEALQAYLRSGGNAVEAAKNLHLHRSTLYYRLEKISAITGHDLSSGSARQELHLSSRIALLMLGRESERDQMPNS